MKLNPMLWLHWRIMGSSRTNLIIAIAYAALIITFSAASFYVARQSWETTDGAQAAAAVNRAVAAVTRAWLIILAIAQGVFLLLIAPSAIRKAVQRDCDSGMIDSLRLSPMSNLRVILGYLAGAPIQAFVLYGVSVLFGTYFAARYALLPGLGGSIGLATALIGWYIGQVCLLIAGAAVASLTLLVALATSGKGNVIGVAILIGLVGGWAAVIFIPGLALLTGVISANVIGSIISSGKTGADATVLLQAATFQFIYCLILVAAACAKFRRPDRPIFSLSVGLVFTAIWAATLVTGMLAAPQHSAMFSDWRDIQFAQYISSSIAMLLFAFFPLIAGAAERLHGDRARAFGEQPTNPLRPLIRVLPLALTLLTVLCMEQMATATKGSLDREYSKALSGGWYWTVTSVTIGLCLWTHYNWLYCVLARNKRVVVFLPLLLGLVNGMPIFADGVIKVTIEEIADRGDWSSYGFITAFSPFGALALAHVGIKTVAAGLAFQAALGVHAAWLARRERQRLGPKINHRRIDQDIPPSITEALAPAPRGTES